MATSSLRPLPIGSGQAALTVLDELSAAVHGTGSAVLPLPADDALQARRLMDTLGPNEPIDETIALVVATSGTTGTPKGAMLPGAALRASAEAAHARLGGPGRWLLALPAHHIAGLQVLLRSLAAGFTPGILDVSAGFDPVVFARAATDLNGPRRYTSLVPTQLRKALDHPAACAALAELDAVLVGGGATTPALRERALAAGVPVVRTYGMSETCGGCVYDGVALDNVTVDILDAAQAGRAGRIRLGGATVASGYRNMPNHPAFAEPGWYRTDDVGTLHDGVLTVLGRSDDAISTGGLTVAPQVVEAVLAEHPAVRECAVFGMPDERLGERVVAAIVPGTHEPDVAELRRHVAHTLDETAAPREVHIMAELPLHGPGKINRAALRAAYEAPASTGTT